MKKTFNESDINSILTMASAAGGQASGQSHDRFVEPNTFQNTGQVSDQYSRFMTGLFEPFARSTANSLGAYLRADFDMALSSVEILNVRDFLPAFKNSGFSTALTLQPSGSAALLQVENSLVFPIIDVLLGGFGLAATNSRELTEIDLEIMDDVARIISRQLDSVWQPMNVKVSVQGYQMAGQVHAIFNPTEKLTLLTFAVRMNQTSGALVIAYPAALSNAMFREMSLTPRGRNPAASDVSASLRARVLQCRFLTTVGVTDLRIHLNELLTLKPGSLVNLGVSVKTPASFVLGGRACFDAIPVRSGKLRAAQLVRVLEAFGGGEPAS